MGAENIQGLLKINLHSGPLEEMPKPSIYEGFAN